MKNIEVVAAAIMKGESILATQRGYGEFKGKWEFPGGKVEKDENLSHALIREIKEEMNANVNVLDYVDTVEYDYPNFHLVMHLYLCETEDDLEFVFHDDENLEHDNMVWLDINDLENINWLPADLLLIDKLKEKASKYI